VVLVNFWASWCRLCVEEIPSLHRLRDKINNPDFEIITVNVGEGRGRIDKFLARVPVELPLLMDNEGIVSAAGRFMYILRVIWSIIRAKFATLTWGHLNGIQRKL